MARKQVRSLTIELPEEHRACAYCLESLAGADAALYIVVAPMRRAFEFCSWNCLFRWAMRLLYHKALDAKLDTANILSRLGFTRKWGAKIPAAELQSPISPGDQPNGKAKKPKRSRPRKTDGPAPQDHDTRN